MLIALALVLTIISACALDLGYLLQHDVASRLPPLSVHQPIKSVRSLIVERRWLAGFGIQVAGFALYVVALAYAPLSLVQATAAGGIGILAIMVSRITHVPLTRLTRNMIGARELAYMQPHGVLINCSRGPVIDFPALHEALTAGKIAGAGLDVFPQEPPSPSEPLPAVMLTP